MRISARMYVCMDVCMRACLCAFRRSASLGTLSECVLVRSGLNRGWKARDATNVCKAHAVCALGPMVPPNTWAGDPGDDDDDDNDDDDVDVNRPIAWLSDMRTEATDPLAEQTKRTRKPAERRMSASANARTAPQAGRYVGRERQGTMMRSERVWCGDGDGDGDGQEEEGGVCFVRTMCACARGLFVCFFPLFFLPVSPFYSI